MASITVRQLDEVVKQRLAEQAARNGRSMEAEVREILTRATGAGNIALDIMKAAQQFGGVEDLPIPPRRQPARVADFS